MRTSSLIRVLALLPAALLPSLVDATRSSKRGLIYIPNAATPQDNTIWTQTGSYLTWYYNYQASPSPEIPTSLQFVPMLWGAPSATDNSFLTNVQSLISSGMNISYVLSFNEPDGTSATGGSNITPQVAAQTWIRVLEPLRKMGVKLGAPAVTGAPTGFTWLQSFFAACNGGCTVDFFPVHWYGNFEGLASHMGQVYGTFNKSMWITEYALNDANLADTQSFFNTSAEYFDRLSYVTRYSYFGSFRSSKSNVGPNAAMLDANGKLTDIGSWYLGGSATGVIPTSAGGKLMLSSFGLLLTVGACMLWM